MAPSTYTELCQSLGFISSNDCPVSTSCPPPPPPPPPPPCKPITIQYADSPKEYWMEVLNLVLQLLMPVIVYYFNRWTQRNQ
uniref:Ovule protein n=1 Tax=Strongyloides papillosus TaxID=174720 RepID=A0A0N5CDV0_STREA